MRSFTGHEVQSIEIGQKKYIQTIIDHQTFAAGCRPGLHASAMGWPSDSVVVVTVVRDDGGGPSGTGATRAVTEEET
jgi:hypothetical protein